MAIFTGDERLGGDFIQELPLQLEMRKPDMESAWQQHSFVLVKIRSRNKEPVVLVALGAENRQEREPDRLQSGSCCPRAWGFWIRNF